MLPDGNTQIIVALTGLLIFAAWESLSPFFSFFKTRERSRHLFINLLVGAANALVISVLFIGLWAIAANVAYENNLGLISLFRDRVPAEIATLVAVLGFDLWSYTWHRLNHKIEFFWRFHRVHHSDPKMDVSTAGRFHVGEIILSSALRIPIIILLGATVWELVIYETMMFAVVQFHHANIGLPEWLDRVIRIFFVTPAMHKVHHSRIQTETDSNFSAFLSIWDRIGRTFLLRRDLQEIQFGLDGLDDDAHQTIAGMTRTPFENINRS